MSKEDKTILTQCAYILHQVDGKGLPLGVLAAVGSIVNAVVARK